VLKLFRGNLFINFSDILLGHNMPIAFATPRHATPRHATPRHANTFRSSIFGLTNQI
jgi:hypothetical protein